MDKIVFEPGVIKDYDLASKRMTDAINKKYGTNIKVEIVRYCDSCRNEIPKDTKVEFSCRLCHINYDLCEECLKNNDRIPNFEVECPLGYGCKEGESRLYVKHEGKKDIYDYNKVEYKDTSKILFELNKDKITEVLNNYVGMKFDPISMIEQRIPINYSILRDLWIHFRTRDLESLERYGKPARPIDYLDHNLLHLYEDCIPTFRIFLRSLKDDGETHYLCFIYPNGDEWIIEKFNAEIEEKHGHPFGSYLMKFSAASFSRYPEKEILKAMLNKYEEKEGREINDMLLVFMS